MKIHLVIASIAIALFIGFLAYAFQYLPPVQDSYTGSGEVISSELIAHPVKSNLYTCSITLLDEAGVVQAVTSEITLSCDKYAPGTQVHVTNGYAD